MPKKKGQKNHNNHKITELTKGKTRKEEKAFFEKFSGRQLNAVLLIILSSTFLVQGVMRYMELIDRISIMSGWFDLILISLIFLTLSVVSISVGGIVSSLKVKRLFNITNFVTFVIGFLLFLGLAAALISFLL